MVAMLPHKVFAVFRPNDQHLRIMLADKTDSFGRLLADNNATGLLQHGTKQGTNTRRPGTDDEYSVFLGYFGDAAAQKPVTNTSPTKSACSSLTVSGIRFSPWSA